MLNKMGQPRSVLNKFIVRCEGLRICGWQVRIPPWHPHGPFSKFFSDRLYGGNRQAKLAARKFRDDVFAASLLIVPKTKAVHADHSTNTSGLVGVTLSMRHTEGRTGQTSDRDTGYVYWTAYWSADGMQPKRNFSVKKFGFIGAWEKAVALRQEKSGRVYSIVELELGLQYCHAQLQRLNDKGIFYHETVDA